MKLALVFPPLADATQPYASLPALAAFLRERGNHIVSVHDVNLGFSLALWTPERLKDAESRILERLHEIEAETSPSIALLEEHTALMTASLKTPLVRERIEEAVADLRRPETFCHLDRLDHAKRVLRDAAEVLGAESPLLRYRVTGLAPGRIAGLTDTVHSNPFATYFAQVTVPQIQTERPDAVGISITYSSQIVPAVALARLLRQHMQHTAIVLGGQMASIWYGGLECWPEVFDWCDYLIGYEGETALDALLTALEHGRSLDGIPNLARREGGVVRKGHFAAEDVNALPVPDYRGLPLNGYLAPEPVFLLNTSRGCYWSRCKFCSVSPSMRRDFRQRPPKLVLRDIQTLQERHSARCISFGDDCVTPATLRALADALPGAGVSWQCEVRFEPGLSRSLLEDLSRAGCRNLIFGLESYSERTLASMDKGIRPQHISRILEDCRGAGIAFNLQLFFGFPGETEAEARETLRFAAGQLHGAATLSFGRFQLQQGSAVACDPAAYGIRILQDSPRLSADIPYEPGPSHALAMEKELAELVLSRTRFRSLPLKIDAHTLLYLAQAGVSSMAAEYYSPCFAFDMPIDFGDRKWARSSAQTSGTFRDWQNGGSIRTVFYLYDLDRTVELSRLAAWVLGSLREPCSSGELVDFAAAAASESAEAVAPAITSAMDALFRARLIRPA